MASIEELRQIRLKKIENLKVSGVHPYPDSYKKTHFCHDAKKLEDGKSEISIAGRIVLLRSFGKLTFAVIKDQSGKMQIAFAKQELKEEEFNLIEKNLDMGDYIGVKGNIFTTKHGEKTLLVKEWTFLGKALLPLPDKFHGLSDEEAQYRQRYLDMIMNEGVLDRFKFRSDLLRYLREFYWQEGFYEIETPTLQQNPTGAAAKPYFTHNNALDADLVLRISHELPLKMAITGGFEKVFEIGKAFRNEGIDPSHLPEHTHIEHYSAYWNFEDNMKFTEKMFDFLFEKTGLSKKIEIKNKEGQLHEVDFTTPWKRIDFTELLTKDSGINIGKTTDAESLRKAIREKGLEITDMDKMLYPTLLDYLYKKVSRPKIIGPVFLYNYPKSLQPLARSNDKNSQMVDQFQLVVNGWEIIKAYSELVDPIDQQERFVEQAKAAEIGDEEAMQGDDEYIVAMEHGMPPISGWGLGFDRLVTLLTKQDNLRDTVLFPLMKPLNEDKEGTQKAKETKLAVAIINKSLRLERWQEMNTIAHLNAAFGARLGKKLIMQDKIETKDKERINLNIQHAIIIKEANSNDQILELIKAAREEELEVSEFTREMIETTDDKKVIEITAKKDLKDIEYLGVLIFGKKTVIDKFTQKFVLFK